VPGLVFHYIHEKVFRFLPDFRKCYVTVWIYQYDRPLTAKHVHTTLLWQAIYNRAHPERWSGTVSIQGPDIEPFWKAVFYPEEPSTSLVPARPGYAGQIKLLHRSRSNIYFPFFRTLRDPVISCHSWIPEAYYGNAGLEVVKDLLNRSVAGLVFFIDVLPFL